MIKAVGEPQLKECIRSVNAQTRRFDRVSIVNNVHPEADARNKLAAKLKCEWALDIAGDMILYPNAVDLAIKWMKRLGTEGVYEYNFGLYDPFMEKNICCCSIVRTEVYKSVQFKDILFNDTAAGRFIHAQGFKRHKLVHEVQLGTHFENPDNFQVFRRFYSRGVKMIINNNGRKYKRYRQYFLSKNGSEQHCLALDALDLGWRNGYYPTSHNIKFDVDVYATYLKTKQAA